MADQFHKGGTELLAIRPELWSAKFYSTLLATHPFNSSVGRDYEGEFGLGDRVHAGQFPEFSAADTINEEDCVDADAVTVDPLEIIINKQIVKDFIVTDRAKAQAIDAMNQLRDLAVNSVLKKMQSLIIAATVPAVSNAIAYDVASTLGLADILEGKELLDAVNVPVEGRCLVSDAPQMNDIYNISGFTSSDFLTAGSTGVLESGRIPGSLLGFTPKMTTEASGVTYLFHPSYMQVAVQRGLDIRQYDKGVDGCRSERVNVTLLMGESQFSDIRVVTIS